MNAPRAPAIPISDQSMVTTGRAVTTRKLFKFKGDVVNTTNLKKKKNRRFGLPSPMKRLRKLLDNNNNTMPCVLEFFIIVSFDCNIRK